MLIGKANGAWQVRPYFWTPQIGLADRAHRDRAPYDGWHRQGFLRTTPGASVDYGHVAADIAELVADIDLRVIAFDRWRIDVMKKELEALGLELPLEPFGQGYKDMGPAIDALEAELLNARLAHGSHPVLTMCAANAVITRDPPGSRKFDKARTTGRIDGMVPWRWPWVPPLPYRKPKRWNLSCSSCDRRRGLGVSAPVHEKPRQPQH